MFENKVLKRIFVSRRDEMAGGLRIMHNEMFSNMYSSP
jgi:hypothetical protein